MSKDRVIELLTDEEIGLILSSITVLKRQYVKEENSDIVLILDNLYKKINKCEDMGVIIYERL